MVYVLLKVGIQILVSDTNAETRIHESVPHVGVKVGIHVLVSHSGAKVGFHASLSHVIAKGGFMPQS